MAIETDKAVNELFLKLGESHGFAIDYCDYLQPNERITGITSVVLSPVGGPEVGALQYDSDGKRVFFNLDATAPDCGVDRYEITAEVTTIARDPVGDSTNTVKARAVLIVKR